jgi:glycosyltransferase involved in cell wall biosynthesis
MILFVIPNFSGGGAERATLNILISLYQKKYPVQLIVFDEHGPLSTMIPAGMHVHNLNTLTLRKSIIPIIREIYSVQPKIIFSTFGYISIFLIFISFLIPGKFLIWAREANLPSKSLPNSKYPYLMILGYKYIYRYADRILCSSYKMKNEFVTDYSITSSRMSILPNPIDEQYIRRMANIPIEKKCNDICFVAAGRLVRQKGFDRLLQWFSHIDNNKSKLYILGDGPMRAELEEIVHSLDIIDRVSFFGFCNNPWNLIANADAFLLSSRWEGMSNMALEALSCGTPVIATVASGGIAELADSAATGSVVVVDSDQGFQRKMNEIGKSFDTVIPRNSLLPDMYKIDNVVEKMKKWID